MIVVVEERTVLMEKVHLIIFKKKTIPWYYLPHCITLEWDYYLEVVMMMDIEQWIYIVWGSVWWLVNVTLKIIVIIIMLMYNRDIEWWRHWDKWWYDDRFVMMKMMYKWWRTMIIKVKQPRTWMLIN